MVGGVHGGSRESEAEGRAHNSGQVNHLQTSDQSWLSAVSPFSLTYHVLEAAGKAKVTKKEPSTVN